MERGYPGPRPRVSVARMGSSPSRRRILVKRIKHKKKLKERVATPPPIAAALRRWLGRGAPTAPPHRASTTPNAMGRIAPARPAAPRPSSPDHRPSAQCPRRAARDGADRSYTTTRRCRATPRACAPRPRAPPRTPPAHPTMRPGRCLSEDSQSNPHLRKRVFASKSLAGARCRRSCKRYALRSNKGNFSMLGRLRKTAAADRWRRAAPPEAALSRCGEIRSIFHFAILHLTSKSPFT